MSDFSLDHNIDDSNTNISSEQDTCCTGDYSQYQGAPIDDACCHNCWNQANDGISDGGEVDHSINHEADSYSQQDDCSDATQYQTENYSTHSCPPVDSCQPEQIQSECNPEENSTNYCDNSSYQIDDCQPIDNHSDYCNSIEDSTNYHDSSYQTEGCTPVDDYQTASHHESIENNATYDTSSYQSEICQPVQTEDCLPDSYQPTDHCQLEETQNDNNPVENTDCQTAYQSTDSYSQPVESMQSTEGMTSQNNEAESCASDVQTDSEGSAGSDSSGSSSSDN